MGGVEPDFRTISDFRKDNIDSLNKIFYEFNRRVSGAVEWGYTSIDGSKFSACNSKSILDDTDRQEDFEEEPDKLTKELVEEKLKETRGCLEKYEGYQKLMEESSQSQMSLTDADARLMKVKLVLR